MPTLAQAIRKKKGLIEPVYNFQFPQPEELRKLALQAVEDAVVRKLAEVEAELREDVGRAVEDAVDDLLTEKLKPRFKGEPGDKGDTVKGDQGNTPTDKELISLIEPLIPPPIEGKTPTQKELLALIRPLIPEAEKINNERLLSLIIPLIPPAKYGSPDTPQQIVEKINTLEEKIEQKTIKGLDTVLRSLYNSIREKKGGGGGMGNVQHESVSVSSATTTVSINSRIAGGGFAIWAYYQGQLIVRGTHYTVGGDYKTLTLLFTPQDSTAIDLIYFRT